MQQLEDMIPFLWEPDAKTRLELELEASIQQARSAQPPPRFSPTAPGPSLVKQEQKESTVSPLETVAWSTLTQLIGGCGIAAIDGYIAMKEYAASKGIDLVEFQHKGIDLQDLLSTLLIHTQKMAELEGRQEGAKRWKR